MAVIFGKAALILSIVLIFFPLGGYVTPLVGLLALLSRARGHYWGMMAIVLSLANLLFLSPLIFLAAKAGYHAGEWQAVIIWLSLMAWLVLAGVALAKVSAVSARTKLP
ncbi:MAG: hypothetical protein G8345_12800 [Magnetococcales bacterium]|nr:hypothetical protein [Magnetococcales bacterium]NGZ27750.1 hypothetical protein [Magnetococcales bacterium]